ncbi:hypothetical protein GGF42_000147 [Coemansia sp. RSA 2424]|nr:hypothetical protein GGF42_000147 [Coemansia sp. RSA 2424]
MAGPLQRSTVSAHSEFSDSYGYLTSQPVAYTIVFAPIFGAYMLYILATFSAFVYRALYLRDKSLLERSVFLLSMYTITGTLFTSDVLVRGFVTNYPCFIDIWLLSSGYVLWAASIVLYMARYYVIVRYHKRIEAETRVNPVTPDNLVEYMTRLRLATQQVFGQNTTDFGEAASTTHPPVVAQNTGARFSLIERVLSWRRQEAATDAVLTESKGCQQACPQHSIGLTLESAVDSIALDIPPPDSGQAGLVSNAGDLPPQSANAVRVARRKKELEEKWVRRLQSDRFAAYVLCGVFVALVGYSALLSSLFTRLKLGRLYYNCFRGAEYIPQLIITGVFNIIVCPAYMVVIWHYHDAYGIRNLMCIACAMGVVFWAAIIAWRLNPRWSNPHMSASIVYIAQMVFVYTCHVVVPLISSVRLSFARRRLASRSNQDVEQDSVLLDSNDLFQVANDSLKREFLDDMQNADKHEEVKRFAASCFCTELVLFLDVFQALKHCVYRDMLATISGSQSNVQLRSNVNSGARSESHSIATTASTRSTSLSTPNWGVRNMYDEVTTRSSESRAAAPARTSLVLGRKNLAHALFKRGAFKSMLRPKRKLHDQSSKQNTTGNPQTSAYLQSLTTGITKTMEQAFPEQDIGGYTEFPESMREPLCALINTFILPESPLAINVNSSVVGAAREYLDGGAIAYAVVDQACREVIDLLYSNVYVRYRQL